MSTIQSLAAEIARFEALYRPIAASRNEVRVGSAEERALLAAEIPLFERLQTLGDELRRSVPETADEALVLGLAVLDVIVFDTSNESSAIVAAHALVEHLSRVAGRSPQELGVFLDAIRQADRDLKGAESKADFANLDVGATDGDADEQLAPLPPMEPPAELAFYLRARKTLDEAKAGEQAGAVIAYQMGAFWEFFLEDAEYVSAVLGIALVKRDTFVPMCGVPVQLEERYFPRLQRPVVRISSLAGTQLESDHRVVEECSACH